MNFLIKLLFVVGCVSFIEQLFCYSPTQIRAFKTSLQNSGQITNCSGCDFRGADLQGLDAHGAFLPGALFQVCIPNDVNRKSSRICVANQVTNLTGINLAKAFLFSSCLDGVILDKADLSGADFSNSSLQNASLKGAQITGIIVENTTFCNAIMPDGEICTDMWTGQGVTLDCNCPMPETSAK